ncbi:tumor protein p53-inducible protein 13 [Rhinatrema bivittatum]|uniref:tumor protein p53-inducible protein 13 n=1 Tax=Rhinatrema bivittatum TaxID=194408 RepID=UPI001128E1B3|nr:tumor protein p53-inducible protein 13 [Rhinatrema bivittatum]XP_029467053.1 tumor protein p53-inducible protein 13 [Rhinatrema bivittatum]XP_029467054.1 tumor protein p53-inducible protein 13 [Rhinatrema bivittatum]XP_029467055.1 tumor protein p53-inducible protein 13 [Rhinatrema bivittatum]XP_029467056.1 tumor protein p53-inducible protein 13 [Rhinatrema bivittatum]XP_029467057.1 tumor protein p53-inducible protein 13 [Rhinatrema bivittatum]XP_029467058.1 tumor protein p53-inducible prot
MAARTAAQAPRQARSARHLAPRGAAAPEGEGSPQQHPATSERLTAKPSWERNAHPTPPIASGATMETAPTVPHKNTSSRKIAEGVLGRAGHNPLRQSKQQEGTLLKEATASKGRMGGAAPTQGPPHLPTSPGPEEDNGGSVRGACTCPVQDPHSHHLALAQKGAMAEGTQVLPPRPHNTHIPTPRTDEAAWAAAAITFLFVLLALAVLYTRLYRNFRRGQSLYWNLGSDCEGQETVTSVIKRRLLSRQSRHKRWQRARLPAILLRENSSESSD